MLMRVRSANFLEGFLTSVETNGCGRLVSFPRGGSIKRTTHGNALGILTFSLPKTSARVLPLLQSATEGGNNIGRLIWDSEAVEE
jgi:hypothetical protein